MAREQSNQSHTEQRRYPRVAFFGPVIVSLVPDGNSVRANATDLSVGGVGVCSGQLLAVGQVVTVRFLLSQGASDVMGRVVHGRADEKGCVMGIESLRLLDARTEPELMRRLFASSGSPE